MCGVCGLIPPADIGLFIGDGFVLVQVEVKISKIDELLVLRTYSFLILKKKENPRAKRKENGGNRTPLAALFATTLPLGLMCQL
jgi:hypothetical protein